MVNNSDTKVSYQGNGQTTVFPFSFPFIQRDYIKVAIYDSLTDETKTIDSDYYVDTVANAVIYPGYEPGQEPAEALRPPILPATSTITIYRQTDVDQLTNLGEKYPLKDIENMADKLTEIIQEQAETLGRAVKVPVGDPKTPEEKLTDLQNYVKSAADSAADAATSESSAQRAAEAAATSEANAAESERLASGYADTASDAASRAEDSAISARAYNAPDYDNETTYQAGDVVTYTDGNSYRALQETTGNEPPNIIYWQQVTDYVGDNFFEIDEYGYIVPMDSPSHSRYWRVDQNGYIVPIEGGDGGYRPDTRQLSAEYLNVTNEGYIKHLRADDIAAQEVDADEMTAQVAAFNTLVAGTVTADDIIAKGPVVDVRAFGAVGDGVTDDTEAFRLAAVNAEDSILIVPKGSYKITDNVIVDAAKVFDAGVYTDIKPVYPTEKTFMKSMNQFIRKTDLTTNDATLDAMGTQGIGYNSKTNKLLVGLKGNSDTAQTIAVFNGDSYAYETSYNYTELGHIDTLAYVPDTDEIYVDWIDQHDIVVLNANTMAVDRTIRTDYAHCGVAYDTVCKVFVAVEYIQPVNKKYRIHVSDKNFNELYYRDIELPASSTKNGLEVHDGHVIFFCFKYVVECDLFGNNLNIITLNANNSDNLLLELEDLVWINNKYVAWANPNKQLFEIRENLTNEFAGPVKNHPYRGADLNSLIDPGEYSCICDPADEATYHYPAGVLSGFVKVFKDDLAIKQVFYRIGDGPGLGLNSFEVYSRQYRYDFSGWADWLRVDSQVQIAQGYEVISAAANAITEKSVTFPFEFRRTPQVYLTLFTDTSNVAYSNIQLAVRPGTSKTGFKIRVLNGNADSYTPAVQWLAIGYK